MASYTYYADNLRASKNVNGTEKQFYWNGSSLAAETSGTEVKTYAYDLMGVAAVTSGADTTYFSKDTHNDIVLKLNASGEVMSSQYFDSFGNKNSPITEDEFGYTGEYMDAESGLIYLRNRYYDPENGRFINEDPIRDGLNWYVYCANNPVVFRDPWGLDDIPNAEMTEEVLLYYILEKEDGKIISYDSATRTAQFTYNGQNYSISGREVSMRSPYYNINNIESFRLAVDRKELGKIIGSAVKHNAGDEFDSLEDAVMAFGVQYGATSINSRYEIGSYIYSFTNENGQNKFSFSSISSSRNSWAVNIADTVPSDGRKIGSIHTHAQYRSNGINDDFSNETGRGDVHTHEKRNLQFSFLISNGGYAKVLMGQQVLLVKTLSTTMPYDNINR